MKKLIKKIRDHFDLIKSEIRKSEETIKVYNKTKKYFQDRIHVTETELAYLKLCLDDINSSIKLGENFKIELKKIDVISEK